MSSLRRTAPCAIDSAPRAWRPAALLLAAIVAAAPARAQPAQAPQAPVAPQAPASAAAPAAPSAPTQVAPASPEQVSPASPQQTSPASATQGVAPAAPFVVTPSFDCSKRVNAAQRIVCADTALSALDAKLGQVFTDVWRRQPQDKNLAYFAAEQRDWTASRDGCPQTSNPTGLPVERLSHAHRRTARALPPRPVRGPFRFACEGSRRARGGHLVRNRSAFRTLESQTARPPFTARRAPAGRATSATTSGLGTPGRAVGRLRLRRLGASTATPKQG